jgi:hypothetical protein
MHVLSCMATGEQHKRALICRHRLFGVRGDRGVQEGGVGAGGDVAKRKHTIENNAMCTRERGLVGGVEGMMESCATRGALVARHHPRHV